MNFIKLSFAGLVFSSLGINAQTMPSLGSHIIHANPSDTAILNIEMSGASYDIAKNKLPYYVVSKPTSYNQSAVPALVVKKTRLVEEAQASVLKKYFSSYITNQFELEKNGSLTRNTNLNQYKLFPFRLTSYNQFEELVSYEINWQITKNDNSAAREAASFANNSVLGSGNWYKIGVTQTGIHKLSKSFFSSIGINTNTLNHRKIRIYGNGGKMLPELNKSFRHDDLKENAIRVVLAPDSSLDYVLFYATGPTGWERSSSTSKLEFNAVKNLYSDTSFYFVTVDLESGSNGKRIGNTSSLTQTPNVFSNSYDYYNYHEDNTVTFVKSGRELYGEYFDITNAYTFTWNDGDFIVGDSIMAEVKLAALYKDTTSFYTSGNGLSFFMRTAAIQSSTYTDYAAAASKIGRTLNQNSSDISITVRKQTSKSVGWFDKITVNARRRLVFSNKQFSFRDSKVTAANKVCKFSITSSANSNINLWNVTDPLNPMIQNYNLNGSGFDFTAKTDSLAEFCIAPTNDFYNPVFVGKVLNQNLHNISQADYIIVTHPSFIKEAQRLAVLHQQKEGLSYAIATTDQIYNEFSSGRPDLSAIRDFIRMLYSRNISTGKEVKYVLLMGDGSYNNKNRSLVNNSALIPTYQSHSSFSPVSSITTDDFFGLMDPDEGFNAEGYGKVDIGIGRFPCRTINEVKSVIAKIENYYSKDPNYVATNSVPESGYSSASGSTMGDWRNWLLFLGDDEDSALHMGQSNDLTESLKVLAPAYTFDKIFLDAYQRFSTPGGNRYPDASEDFLRRIKKGALIFNYTGHGGEVGLTAERMIDINIINNMDNFNRLPLFITATCEFSRYDDPARTSAGELCLLNNKGGAIGLFTTCRLAFANYNYTLNLELLTRLFSRKPDGKRPTLGDVIMETKSSSALGGQTFYYANFHLLGDPALTLAYPEQKVITSSINNIPVSPTGSDTLGALSKITVKGFVADTAGNKLSNFNGLVYPTVFDKEQTVVSLMNTEASGVKVSDSVGNITVVPFEFKLQKNILYRGKCLATNGEFSFTFIVPKDISFSIGPGKISYYATNGLTDANGYYKQLKVGGSSSKNTIIDNEGPQVNLFLNDKNFVNGGLTNEKPVLFADLTDSSGINTIGTGIGHDISVILDENSSKPVVLNDYYESNLNSYQSGRVRYPYNELSEGEHRLSFKVWDIQNNSSTVYSDFIVAKSAELALKHVLNYPNPFTTRTKFIFQHNQNCSPLKVTVQIYTVSGKIVKTIQKSSSCEGSMPEGIEWDGKDDYGDKLARGVYIYKLAILDVDNKKAEKIEKLVILN